MEEEIQEQLEKIYEIPIIVKFIDFRIYKIIFNVGVKIGEINYKYEGLSTLNYNVENIVKLIDKEIVKLFKRGE